MAVRQAFVGHKVVDIKIQQLVHIVSMLAQSGYVQRDDVQMIEKVITETSLGDLLLQVALGGCDDAQVHLYILVATKAYKGTGLQHTEQACLRLQVHISNIANTERPAIGLFQPAIMNTLAFLAAEQFRR